MTAVMAVATSCERFKASRKLSRGSIDVRFQPAGLRRVCVDFHVSAVGVDLGSAMTLRGPIVICNANGNVASFVLLIAVDNNRQFKVDALKGKVSKMKKRASRFD